MTGLGSIHCECCRLLSTWYAKALSPVQQCYFVFSEVHYFTASPLEKGVSHESGTNPGQSHIIIIVMVSNYAGTEWVEQLLRACMNLITIRVVVPFSIFSAVTTKQNVERYKCTVYFEVQC
eukprot:scpid105813/ scgid22860/ 